MTRIIEAETAKSSEKNLYKPKKTLLYKAIESEPHYDTTTRKAELIKARNTLAKKRGLMVPEKDVQKMDEEEATLVGIAVKSMMQEVKSGKRKTYKLDDVLEEENRRRGLR